MAAGEIATTKRLIDSINDLPEDKLEARRESYLAVVKRLSKERAVLKEELDRNKIEMIHMESALTGLNLRLIGQPVAVEANWKDKLHVTDHALMRYLERVVKIDLAGHKKHLVDMLPDEIPFLSTSVKTGKTIFRLHKEKDRTTIVTILTK